MYNMLSYIHLFYFVFDGSYNFIEQKYLLHYIIIY